jgi:hypothetical protein
VRRPRRGRPCRSRERRGERQITVAERHVTNDLADLKGIGPKYAEMLKSIGIDSIKELRHRNPAHLKDDDRRTAREGGRIVRGRMPDLGRGGKGLPGVGAPQREGRCPGGAATVSPPRSPRSSPTPAPVLVRRLEPGQEWISQRGRRRVNPPVDRSTTRDGISHLAPGRVAPGEQHGACPQPTDPQPPVGAPTAAVGRPGVILAR